MKHFKNIMCALDSGKDCVPVLERAVSLAQSHQASLTVVDVAPLLTAKSGGPGRGVLSSNLQSVVVSGHAQELEAVVNPYRKRIKIETRILVGTPFLELIREVLRNAYDLLIRMPQPQHWTHRFFGSDDMNLLRKCPCPVWLIKPQAPKACRRVLAAVDVDDQYLPREIETRHELNRAILEEASAIAVADFAELHVVHAWQAVSESALRHGAFKQNTEDEVNTYVEHSRRHHSACLDALLQEVAANQGQGSLDYLQPTIHMVKGWARQEIPVLAKGIEADLVVMGTIARTGVPGFIMGNTAETILNHLDCSVLALKPPGFVTPVRPQE